MRDIPPSISDFLFLAPAGAELPPGQQLGRILFWYWYWCKLALQAVGEKSPARMKGRAFRSEKSGKANAGELAIICKDCLKSFFSLSYSLKGTLFFA